MPVRLEGALADRSTWRVDNCSIAMAIEVVGARSTMLVLREALYGTRRFDDFVRRTHSTDAVVAARLKQLTALGILIGITAVILTVGLGAGAKAQVRDQINELGTNLLVVSPGSTTSSSGVRGGQGSASTLTTADAAPRA